MFLPGHQHTRPHILARTRQRLAGNSPCRFARRDTRLRKNLIWSFALVLSQLVAVFNILN
jgi:hypothetical protein